MVIQLNKNLRKTFKYQRTNPIEDSLIKRKSNCQGIKKRKDNGKMTPSSEYKNINYQHL